MTTPPSGDPPAFTIEASQNPHLAGGGDRVDAVLTVTASRSVRAPDVRLLLGFVLDVSGSMEGDRIDRVRAAVQTAIGLLDERSDFFVVAFSHEARVLLLPLPATAANRQRAADEVAKLRAGGGTAMSQGLALARSVFVRAPGAIRQCLFLTDGRNESEEEEDVAVELRRCAGIFACDCWGVGTDWRIGEVQAIARALLGRASLVPEPEGIEAAFRAAVDAAQAKSVRDVRLRIWSPATVEIVSLEQVSPTIEDLTARTVPVSPPVREVATGAWAPGDSRDYLLGLRVTPGAIGDRMLAARPSVVYRRSDGSDAEVVAPAARVFAEWTVDERLFSRLDDSVAHYNGQQELAQAIQTGLDARERGEVAAATELLGRAVQLAHESGNTDMSARLKKVVDVVDEPRGSVILKASPAKADTMDLELESTTTLRASRPEATPVPERASEAGGPPGGQQG